MTSQGRNAIDVLLAESFKELTESRPIEKITIKEITDKAGVIRPTFYNHFQDKYELLEWIVITEVLEPMRPLLQNGMIQQALLLLFTSLEKEKSFYMKACHLEGQNSFESIVKKCIADVLLGILLDSEAEHKKLFQRMPPELIAEYHAQSMCFLALSWIKSGMSASPEEMADIYDYMIHHSIDDVLKEK